MSDPEVFPRAPITEAVLDIRVQPKPNLNLAELGSVHENIRELFPEKQGITAWEAGFEFNRRDARSLAQASAKPIGFLFRSADQTKVVQVTESGFTFNKLKPYEHWSALRDEARRLWDEYNKIAQPVMVTRVALRYINRIELPMPFADFKEYILTVPEVAPGIPQALDQFVLQLQIAYSDAAALAVINLTMDRSEPIVDKLPIIFDIDVFRESDHDPLSDEIWQSLETLRVLKNEIFFHSLTDKARELFR
jgi:uncharacterized protein (TIGR04255 family)